MALRDWTTTRKHDGWHPPAEGYRQTGLGEPNQTQEEKMVKSEKKKGMKEFSMPTKQEEIIPAQNGLVPVPSSPPLLCLGLGP